MTTGDETADAPSLRATTRGLRRWVPLILVLTLLAFVGTLLIVGPSTTTYSSTASLELTDDVSTLINSKNKATDARREIEAQTRLLGSSENFALLRESMGPLGVDVIRLDVEAVEDEAVLTVTAVAVTPETARVAAQLAVDNYLEVRLQSEIDEQNVQLGPLREQRTEQLALIDELSAEIESIRNTAAPSEISILEARAADALNRLDTYNIAIQEGEFFIQTADGDVTLVTKATVASAEESSSLTKALLVALVVMILAIVVSHLLHRVRGPMHLVEEIAAAAGPDNPILAVVPSFKHSLRKGSAALVVRSHAASPEAEAFRYLRGSIELGLHGQDHYSIAFTSAEQAEGKSVTVGNYALAAARASTDLVLVDSDFLNPSVARLFGKPAEGGFAKVLRGNYQPLEDPPTVSTSGRPLSLITSTSASGDERLEFTSDAVGAAVEKIGAQWSVVALDCPPILRVSDAATVAAAADHAVLVVRLGRTRKLSMVAAMGLLEQSGAHLLGIVVTHAKDRSNAYGRYDYKYAKKAVPTSPEF